VRQVAKRLVFDSAVLTVAAPQQIDAIQLVFVLASRGDDVSGSGSGVVINIPAEAKNRSRQTTNFCHERPQ
jgi:hypothetical protein